MDVRQGEKVERKSRESELTYFTERCHDQRMQSEGEKAREELWQASVRAYNARQGEDQRQARRRVPRGPDPSLEQHPRSARDLPRVGG